MPGDAGDYLLGLLQQDKAVNNHWLVLNEQNLLLFDIITILRTQLRRKSLTWPGASNNLICLKEYYEEQHGKEPMRKQRMQRQSEEKSDQHNCLTVNTVVDSKHMNYLKTKGGRLFSTFHLFFILLVTEKSAQMLLHARINNAFMMEMSFSELITGNLMGEPTAGIITHCFVLKGLWPEFFF